jgi:hypothetical protein
VANLRGGAPADPDVEALVAELAASASDDFTRHWEARPVERTITGTVRIAHPEVGLLTVQCETLQLSDRDDQRLVVYLPDDEETARAFDRLSGRHPGALHAVGG